MIPAIIIPTYCEADSLPILLPSIAEVMSAYPLWHLVIVDDGSPDETRSIAKQCMQTLDLPLTLINRKHKQGLGSAYLEGFARALDLGATHLIQMDADGSHDPSDLARLLHVFPQADVVIGSRRIAGGRIIGWNLRRHIMSAGAMWLARMVLQLQTKDVTAGFRALTAQTAEYICAHISASSGYAFQEEVIWLLEKNNTKIQEIPVVFRDRELGSSKLGLRDALEFFVVIIRLRFRKN
jgi:dolichol-phosphate mannosyltransferase